MNRTRFHQGQNGTAVRALGAHATVGIRATSGICRSWRGALWAWGRIASCWRCPLVAFHCWGAVGPLMVPLGISLNLPAPSLSFISGQWCQRSFRKFYVTWNWIVGSAARFFYHSATHCIQFMGFLCGYSFLNWLEFVD